MIEDTVNGQKSAFHKPSMRRSRWPARVAAVADGEPVLVPGRPEDELQWIDARDLAAFVIQCVEQGATGTDRGGEVLAAVARERGRAELFEQQIVGVVGQLADEVFERTAGAARSARALGTHVRREPAGRTAYQQRRCEFVVGIGYDDDEQKAKQIILDILNNDRNVLSQPAFSVNVTALADFSVNLTVRWWVDTTETDMSSSTSTIQAQVKQAFNENGINIPYPIQELKMAANQPLLNPEASTKQTT